MNSKEKSKLIKKCPCCKTSDIGNQLITSPGGIKYIICQKCKSWFHQEVIELDYNDNYWGTVVDPDGKTRNLLTEKDFKIKNWYCDAIPFVNSLPAGKILDIGAGLGFFLSAINDSWEKHAHELSDFATKFMNENFPKIKTVHGELTDDTFAHGSFDVIMFYHVIEHLHKPDELLSLLTKYLKSGGYIIVGSPNVGSWLANRFKGNYRLLGKGHVCLYTKESLKNYLSNFGLKEIKTEYPFWKTEYAKSSNLLKLINTKKLSPPFRGSIMTIYCQKSEGLNE